MQTQFGCCIIDGEIVEKKNKKSEMKNKKTKTEKNGKKIKKTVHQNEVEFE